MKTENNLQSERVSIDFSPQFYEALQAKSAVTGQSISDLVNEAVRLAFTEDMIDIAAFSERAQEPDLPFDEVVKGFQNE